MIPEAEAVEFVNEISQTTGVLVSFGVNAYYVNPESSASFVVFIDPSYLNGDAESKIEAYAERKGLRVDEAWSDWGRFIRISKPRRVSVSAFSP
jgi:hypothetical protein